MTDPANAGIVTFMRSGSWIAFWAPIRVQLEGQDLVRLGRNEHYSLRLDPGEYIVDFSIGLNQCRRVIRVLPNRTYRYLLVPNCHFVET